MPDYVIYDVTVSLITPLHIGSGQDLLNEYDYAIYKGQTWRINEDALLEAQDVDDPRMAAQLARTPPGQLLEKPVDFRAGAPFFRYVLQGTPRSSAEGAQLREQIKDPYDRPYLPGSSFKGALRTALAWYGWGQKGLQPEIRHLRRSPKWAGQDYERALLGRNPNHDLLRALHVGDSEPVGTDRLMVLNVRVLNRVGGLSGAPVEMEAVRPETTFRTTIKLDLALFSRWAGKGGLKLQGREWLQNLSTVVNSHSQQHAQREAAWFGQMRGAERVLGLYQQLAGAKLPAGRFIVELGWGTGWADKTFGSRLQADQAFMDRVIHNYRLARGRREPGDPFPKSRRVAVSIQRDQQGGIRERPATPLGWALVEMKERAT